MTRQRRRRRGVKWLSHYSSAQTILVVGDGDMSFSLALAAAFRSGDNLVATSLESYDALTSKYGKAESNVTELKRLGATVLHGVDAKTMKRHPCLKMRQFDRIVFNFPHAGFIGYENGDHMINAHQLLVRRFFRNASHLLCPDGEIHISHTTGQYDKWKIKELASEFSLVMFETVAFRKEYYPGYNQKRGDGKCCDEKFPLYKGWTSKFCVEYEEVEECAQKGYSTHNLVNQSSQTSQNKVVKQVWRPKSPSAEISESNKQEKKNTSADTIKIGTKELEIKELGKGLIVIGNPTNSNGGIAVVQQGPMANDPEASTSKSKPRDPKYTQPKWCPPRLSNTKKTRLQRMRNQEKVEQEAETVKPPKSLDSLLQTVKPVEPPKSQDSPVQMVASIQVSKPLDSRSASSGSGTVGSDLGAAPFDICMGKSPCFSASVIPPMAGGGSGERKPATSSSSARQRKPRVSREFGPERSSESQKEGPCSSSPSVSSKKSPLQMITPVLRKSLDSPVQPPKSLDSPLQTVKPVEPPKSQDSPVQMFASIQVSKPLDSGSASSGSGTVASDFGAAPFDICMGNSKGTVKLKRGLLEINREKRRARELSNSAPVQHLRPGMVLLKNFLKPDDQVKIIERCRDLGVGPGGFYQPGYREGGKLSLRMMCLGKNWDPDSSLYGDIRPFDAAQPPKIPEELTKFVKDAIEASHEFLKQRGGRASNPPSELPLMSPDICVVNFYTSSGKLGLHQDKDEEKSSLARGLPVVSFSLGDTAEFLYGDDRDEAKALKIKLESGDVLIFGGQSRHIFHGVSSIALKTAPLSVTDKANLRPGRLNLTFRQYE